MKVSEYLADKLAEIKNVQSTGLTHGESHAPDGVDSLSPYYATKGELDALEATVEGTTDDLASQIATIAQDVTAHLAESATKAELSAAVHPKADKTYVDTLAASLASGSPAGVYTTAAALAAAIPEGDDNIYVVTADGNWYYWNESTWTSGGVYQSTGIPSDVQDTLDDVTDIKTALKYNKNLFNPNDENVVVGIKTLQGTNGVVNYGTVTNTITGYIPVNEDKKVYFSTNSVSVITTRVEAFSDIGAENYISGSAKSGVSDFTPPNGTKYIRVVFEGTDENMVSYLSDTAFELYQPTRYAPIPPTGYDDLLNEISDSKTGVGGETYLNFGDHIRALATALKYAKNLFNPNDENVVVGIKTLQGTNGVVNYGIVTNTITGYIPVNEDKKVYFSENSIPVSVTRVEAFSEIGAENYISRSAKSGVSDFTPPNGTKYIRVVFEGNSDKLMVAGSIDPTYADYQSTPYAPNVPFIEQDEKLPYYIESNIKKICEELDNKQNGDTVSIAFMTDQHFSNLEDETFNVIKRAVRALNEIDLYNNIDAIVLGGDVTKNGSRELVGKMFKNLQKTIVGKVNFPVLVCKGNHCDNTTSNPARVDVHLSDADRWKLVGKHFEKDLVMNYGDIEKSYGYYDIPNHRVRCLFLNCIDIPYTSADGVYLDYRGQNVYAFRQKQLDFVAQALNFVENGWKVVVFSHILPTNQSTILDNFTGNMTVPASHGGASMWGIIQAYKNKTTFVADVTTSDFESSVNVDYTLNASNEIVACIAGHNHVDRWCVLDGVLMISTRNMSYSTNQTDLNLYWNTDGSTYIPTYESETETSYDIFTIDTKSNLLNATRYGLGINRSWDISSLPYMILTLDSYDVVLGVDGTHTITASVGINNCTCDTSNATIATVASGVITGVAAGICTITVDDGITQKTINVTVV